MAEAAAAAGAPPSGDATAKPGFRLSFEFILVLLNTLALLGAGGALFYTKLIFKRPMITEDSERERLSQLHQKAQTAVPGAVLFDTFTANIVSSPPHPGGVDGTGQQIRGRLHYATLAFSLELRDSNKQGEIEDLRPRIMDTLLSILGRKTFNELVTAQGRYLLRTQIVSAVNRLIAHYEAGTDPTVKPEDKPAGNSAEEPENEVGAFNLKEGLVSNAFFTQFVVQ